MAEKVDKAPENTFGLTDPAELEERAGEMATARLFELEHGEPLTSFTAEDLSRTHEYILQDIYPWSGQLRTEEVGAMGMPMCRSDLVPEMLNNVMRDIQKNPPSRTDKEEALRTVAGHWGEMTIVHPFRDGNSRTQRLFFDQMMRDAGWGIDWTVIDNDEVHAARYVAAATMNADFLADALRPGVKPAAEVAIGSLSETQGDRDARRSAEMYHDMRAFRRDNPGLSYHDEVLGDATTVAQNHGLVEVSTPPSGFDIMTAPGAGGGIGFDHAAGADEAQVLGYQPEQGNDADAGLGE